MVFIFLEISCIQKSMLSIDITSDNVGHQEGVFIPLNTDGWSHFSELYEYVLPHVLCGSYNKNVFMYKIGFKKVFAEVVGEIL